MSIIVKCPICGTDYDGDSLVDPCPFCDWIYDFTEDEPDVRSGANPITLTEARKNFAKGLNIWGDPLPKGPETK